jgi:hypothetical protein
VHSELCKSFGTAENKVHDGRMKAMSGGEIGGEQGQMVGPFKIELNFIS